LTSVRFMSCTSSTSGYDVFNNNNDLYECYATCSNQGMYMAAGSCSEPVAAPSEAGDCYSYCASTSSDCSVCPSDTYYEGYSTNTACDACSGSMVIADDGTDASAHDEAGDCVGSPTPVPTPVPTYEPTAVPTYGPSPVPSPLPTSGPIYGPSPVPTMPPTSGPTPVPTTEVPTILPTGTPSYASTPGPTMVPTAVPTHGPTAVPIPAPSSAPSYSPTAAPYEPTAAPTAEPTAQPTPKAFCAACCNERRGTRYLRGDAVSSFTNSQRKLLFGTARFEDDVSFEDDDTSCNSCAC